MADQTHMDRLLNAMGFDPKAIQTDDDFEKVVRAATVLERVRITMLTSEPEKTGALFVCGIAGARDEFNLPDYIHVCPTYGLDGFAVYRKERDYDGPGW